MIDGLSPYPEYKESGLMWLDRIPIGWAELRSKYLFREVDQRSVTGSELRLSMSQRFGLIPSTEVAVKRLTAKSNIGGKVCEHGDMVLNRLKAHLGVFALAPQRGIVSPDYSVFRAIGAINAKYFCTLYRSPYCGQELRRTAKGIVEGFWRLYTDQFYDISVPVPPPEEQAAIVRFLDHASRKIDGFIRAKRKLIGLLNEQKQAIIHRAVTRGLNPHVPLKPSGIPWLGDIPKHWDVIPLKGVCKIQSGVTLGKTYIETQLKEYPYLRVANVQSGHLSLSNVKVLRLPSSEAHRSTLRVGDVLMTEGGDPDKLGRGCVWNGEIPDCIHQNHVFAVRPSQRMQPQYLAALLESNYAKLYFIRTAKQTTNLASTNKTIIGQFRILMPPVSEQESILAALASELAPVVAAITRTDREISLMLEYRARLTADIVTGKRDVRKVAARLPGLPSESLSESFADEPIEEDGVEVDE